MKKTLILLTAIVLLGACNNDKAKGKGGLFGGLGGNNKDNNKETNNNRNKDDYGNKDDRNKDDRNKDDNNDNGNNKGGGWTNSDRNAFLQECKTQIADQPGVPSDLCSCVLGKLEKEFTDLKDLDARGTEEEGKRLSLQCINGNKDDRDNNYGGKEDNGNGGKGGGNGGGNWSESDRKSFVDVCSTAAEKGGMSQRKAESYCTCMEGKMERLYPNSSDANKITNEDMKTEEMQKMVKDCLGMDN
jgi:hypothetical protein